MQQLKNIFHFSRRLLAKYILKLFPSVTIIGVTGSVGKTTTKEMIFTVLREEFRVIKTKDNLDPIFNIPLTLLKINPFTKMVVLEMGVDHFGDMDKYLWLVKPSIGVVTGIYWTHTEFLKNLAGVAREKGKLLEALSPEGWAVLNWDEKRTREMAKLTKASVFFYGTDEHSNLIAKDIKSSKNGLSFSLKQIPKGRQKRASSGENCSQTIKINLNIIGRHNIYCALAAASVGIINGLSFTQIKRGLEKLTPLPSRLNILASFRGSTLIDDSYNANPAAVEAALETLKDYPGRRKIAVLGEMKELGSFSQKGHRRIGKRVAQLGIDYLLVFGQKTSFIVQEAIKGRMKKDHIWQVKTIAEIGKRLKNLLQKDDVVLLKGSRFSHMERVILLLKEESVACNLVTCHQYTPCSTCPNLKKKV